MSHTGANSDCGCGGGNKSKITLGFPQEAAYPQSGDFGRQYPSGRNSQPGYHQPGCHKYCPTPCPPEWPCGSGHVYWKDDCGRCHRSLITSAPDEAALKATTQGVANQLAVLYANNAISVANLLALGLLDGNSAVIVSTANPNDVPRTYVGDQEIANYLSATFTALRSANPASTATVTFSPQILSNELVSTNVQIVLSGITLPVAGTYTFRITSLSKIVNCGKSPSVVVSGVTTLRIA